MLEEKILQFERELQHTQNIILEEPRITDWEFGGETKLGADETLQESGQWLDYLPLVEIQKKRFDSMSCFPYDTEVLMEDFTTKRISEIKVGEYVFTHLGRKKKVIKTIKLDNDEPLLEIKIKGIYDTLLCTSEHPILTKTGWKEAKELTEKDYVVIPTINEVVKDTAIKEVEKDVDFLWLLGFYLAEGSLGKKQYTKLNMPKRAVNGSGGGSGIIQFSIHQDEKDYANRIIEITKRLFGVDFHYTNKGEGERATVYGYDVNLRNLFEELGNKLSGNKQLNARLMFIEPKLQLELLKGWLDGDGCFQKDIRKIIGVSISKNLIWQMYRILLRNKISSCLYKRDAYGIHKESFEIRICGTEINKIYDWDLSVGDNRVNDRNQFEKNNLFRKITWIEKRRYQKQSNNSIDNVYNLDVEDDNSYIVNSVAVHNCVTFAGLSILEILLDRKYQIKDNYSDRFSAKLNGTTPNGNTFNNFADGIRRDGAVNEEDWPFTDNMTREDYFERPPQDLIYKGKHWLVDNKPAYENVYCKNKKTLMEALKRSPIHIAVQAWWQRGGKYYSPNGVGYNHATILIGFIEDKKWLVFDSYPPYVKELEWDFNFFNWGKKYTINRIIKPILNEENMTFYKRQNDSKIYQYGADEKYHHLTDEPVFKKLYGNFGDNIIKEIEFDNGQIGEAIYFKSSILDKITNTFSKKNVSQKYNKMVE